MNIKEIYERIKKIGKRVDYLEGYTDGYIKGIQTIKKAKKTKTISEKGVDTEIKFGS